MKHQTDTNARYIKINYTQPNFAEVLKQNKLDFEAPTHFIWEGNIMYLDAEQAENIIVLIKNFSKQVLMRK